MNVHRVEKEIGGRQLIIETGKLAKQADGAVTVQHGDTLLLGTAVRDTPREGIDFFPLTVDYREKMNAAGKFPGGFRKREGAPNNKEILTMRNIDRPIRPLFPKGFMDEVQIQCWVMAADTQNEPDVLAGIAASAALSVSSIPFLGPTATVRVGRIEGEFCLFPTEAQTEFSDLDLVLSGHRDGINMIEVGSAEIPEDQLMRAIRFGYDAIQEIVAMIAELQPKAGKPKESNIPEPDPEVHKLVFEKLREPLKQAKASEGSKHERQDAVKAVKQAFLDEHFPKPTGESVTYGQMEAWRAKISDAQKLIHDLEEVVTRDVIRSGKRTDGRGMNDIRPITSEVGVLPRVHGSGLFSRGETQALVTATLGTGKDEQIVDGLGTEYAEKFYLHYNFPPFSVGEAKRITGPGRREIGHGMLAQKALQGVLPSVEDFPYTIRLVSDILESNGSSSMASACGGSLALMDAGVPIKSHVGGISIGLIQADEPGQQDLFLTDIQGEEDHFGDMDFKVTGTPDGITAVQLDLKILGLNFEQIETTLGLARDARIKIIGLLNEAIPNARGELSVHAPRMLTTHIHPDKIGKIIGPGGKTIRALEETTGANIEIQDDGTIYISAVGGGRAEAALEEIEKLGAEVKLGQIYTGKVTSIKDFGAFIEVIPGQDGLCHISELAEGYVKKPDDIVKVGDKVRVKVILIDEQGRVKLSRRAALEAEEAKETDGSGDGKEGKQEAAESSSSS